MPHLLKHSMHRRSDRATSVWIFDLPFGWVLAIVAPFPQQRHDLHVQERRFGDLAFKVWNSVLRAIESAHESEFHLRHVVDGNTRAAVQRLKRLGYVMRVQTERVV